MTSTTLQYTRTPLNEIPLIHAALDATFRFGQLKSVAFRKYLLLQIGYLLKDNTQRIVDALFSDLGKPELEVHLTELGPMLNELSEAYTRVETWAKPEKPAFSLTFQAMNRVIYKQGKGVCLVISPFNYPVSLCVGPIISAIAAGNTVVAKPSESTPAMSSLFAELFPKYVDPSIVRIVNGGVDQATKLLELAWGHIMFTGSGRVGRIVASAAGKTLTPVTLELGGKSPAFVAPSCDLETTAKRLLWGKVANSGQTCVAPDYVLVPREFQDKLVDALKKELESFYPDGPFVLGAMGKMITVQAFKRVDGLLKATKGTVVAGGETDEAAKAIAPTIVKDVTFDDSLMTQEIFGPIMPIIPIDSWEEGIQYVNANDHPLALYVFTTSGEFKKRITESTMSGSILMNEVACQVGTEGLPFGGVGPSGYGQHNGKVYGFDTFTHMRASLDPPLWLDLITSFRYPPYTQQKIKLMGMTFNGLPGPRPKGPPVAGANISYIKWILLVIAGLLLSLLAQRGWIGLLKI